MLCRKQMWKRCTESRDRTSAELIVNMSRLGGGVMGGSTTSELSENASVSCSSLPSGFYTTLHLLPCLEETISEKYPSMRYCEVASVFCYSTATKPYQTVLFR